MTSNDLCFVVRRGQPLTGRTPVPGDKSLSHRAVMFGALADGVTQVRGWLAAGDTEATLRAIQALNVRVERHDLNTLTVYGGRLWAPIGPLDLVNAGTGIRLMAGVMAGQPFPSVLTGSEQLLRRPMKRVIEPLALMGAKITSRRGGYAPLLIARAPLHGIRYELPVASAQVKSAILLAALFATGATTVIEPGAARDHTERMLASMGVDLAVEGSAVTLTPGGALRPLDLTIPGDISSAAFLIVAGLVVPGSDLTLTGVNLNVTRTGLIDVLQAMGGDITVTETGLEGGEPVGEIRVRHSALKALMVDGDVVVRMIDEFPAFMVAALSAEGETVVRDAQELRVKETDRIAVMTAELARLGAQITETPDGFRLTGPQTLRGAVVDGHDDHRIAMSLTVAGLVAEGATIVTDARCTADSFPGFAATLAAVNGDVREVPLAQAAEQGQS
jgi:3-phosphoshikimate 1-carboxyvinyltransferase